VLLHVQRLPLQARVGLDALSELAISGEQRCLDLAVVVEPVEKAGLCPGQRQDGSEERARLVDEGGGPAGDVTGTGTEILTQRAVA